MNQEKYASWIVEWQNVIRTVSGLDRSYNSQLISAAGSKPIKVITGFRRAGKSFLVQRVANTLVTNKVYPLDNILYLNFEDYRLAEINSIVMLDEIIQMFLRDMAIAGRKLLIFDEIQRVPDWDKLIRTLYEKGQDIEIILTGSNSELLSSEIGSNLAGRFVEFEILPFGFDELLKYKNITVPSLVAYHQKSVEIASAFKEFVKFGGLPEILTIQNEETKYSYIQGIISKVILDDIVERFGVRQVSVIDQILRYLLLGVGTIISPLRLSSHLNHAGVNIKQDTVSTYIDYIVKTFALFKVEKFDWKLQRVFSKNMKYYAVDTGLINLIGNTGNNDSRQLENIVYLKLRRSYPQVYYGALANGVEIDFIVKTREGQFLKYQITKTLHVDNIKRELASLAQSEHHLGRGNNILLTLDEKEETLDYEGCAIQKKNLVRWLMGAF